MSEIIISLDFNKPIKFFSKYHDADLYLKISGIFQADTENPAIIRNFKKYTEIIRPEFISALQSALCLLAEKGDIYKMLSDVQTFQIINSYMKVCLEDMEDITFLGFTPEKACFDNESIAVIRITEQLKNRPVELNKVPEISQKNSWKCTSCGCINYSKFCMDCGTPKPEIWRCVCGTENSGTFCSECGVEKYKIWRCTCGSVNKGNFCTLCGKKKDDE